MCLVAFQKIFRKIFSGVWKRKRKRQNPEKHLQNLKEPTQSTTAKHRSRDRWRRSTVREIDGERSTVRDLAKHRSRRSRSVARRSARSRSTARSREASFASIAKRRSTLREIAISRSIVRVDREASLHAPRDRDRWRDLAKHRSRQSRSRQG